MEDRLRVLLVDYSNLAARAFFSHSLHTSKGEHSGMVFGALKMLKSKITRYGVDEVVVALDSKPYWRSLVLPTYKAGRRKNFGLDSADGADFNRQFGDLKKILSSLDMKVVSSPGLEADDILALSCAMRKDEDEYFIYSSDHDFSQLVGPKVTVLRGSEKDPIVDMSNVEEHTRGVGPERYPELLALTGDPTDNIPSAFAEIDGTAEEGYFWREPKVTGLAGKTAKLMIANSTENLLSGKVNPAKGVGGKVVELFLKFSKKNLENYERNLKLVNLRDPHAADMRILPQVEQSRNPGMFLEYIRRYECGSVRESDSFPYFYIPSEQIKSSGRVEVPKTSIASILGGRSKK